jgi:glycerophosphoryl diester phosphodiesterase
VGLLPSLAEVLDTFPDRRFLINVKSNDPVEGERLAAALAARPPEQVHRLMAYGAEKPMTRLRELLPALRVLTRKGVEACLLRYAVVGWTGYLPQTCRDTVIGVPRDRAGWLWGWPHRFVARMQGAGTDVFVLGARRGPDASTGIDTVDALRSLGPDFAGGIGTDRIEVIGPAVAAGS